jgi:photosystem II stability/assembly factor-like uncharacterized protein
VPDPLDPDMVYGGKITRYDRRTRVAEDISPKPLRGADYRVVRTQPVVFSGADPHVLFFASNTLWKTTTGGRQWTQISPDLTRKQWAVPANVGKFADLPQAAPKQRGVIYSIAASPLDVNRIWVGTDDGLIHRTVDGGKTWTDVTPPSLVPWAKVSVMEASHFDRDTAYAAINTFRLDDLRPHIYRTRDGGKSWTHVTRGIPDGEGIVNVVREDPKTKGLLFAGTEREVYVSFDDGEQWQSLRLNMPATSIRDLVLHEDDVVVGTHGRGFWILDDIEPLRQVRSAGDAAYLFKPQRAWRFRWNKNTDTPLPADEPAGENPPDGAILDYWLPSAVSEVTLEVLDGAGNVIRRFHSGDPVPPVKDTGNVPWYWIRPVRVPSAAAGMHRFVWDLHYPPLAGPPSYPIAAVPFNTPPDASSPWVLPGTYTVRLTAGGKTSTQPLIVQMDPRVKTPAAGLAQQFALSLEMYDALRKLDAVKEPAEAVGKVKQSLRALLDILQAADVAPTAQTLAAIEDVRAQMAALPK